MGCCCGKDGVCADCSDASQEVNHSAGLRAPDSVAPSLRAGPRRLLAAPENGSPMLPAPTPAPSTAPTEEEPPPAAGADPTEGSSSHKGCSSAGVSPGYSPPSAEQWRVLRPADDPSWRLHATAPYGSPSPPPRQGGAPAQADDDLDTSEDDGSSTRTPSPRTDAEVGPGGCCPVRKGDVHGDLKITGYLGRGAFGTVWRAQVTETGAELALKVSKSARQYYDAALEEIRILGELNILSQYCRDARLRQFSRRIIKTEFSYQVESGHGMHPCLGLELMGPSLLALAKGHDFRGMDAPIVKTVARMVLQGLAFLAEAGVLHGDIKLENVLLTTACRKGAAAREGYARGADLLGGRYVVTRGEPLAKALRRQYSVRLADFGTAVSCRGGPCHGKRVRQTPEYRAPEAVTWAVSVTPAVDVWSAGCMVYELLTGDFLCNPKEFPLGGPVTHRDVAQWIIWHGTLGAPPPSYADPARYERAGDFFYSSRHLICPSQGRDMALRLRLERYLLHRLPQRALDELERLLRCMLHYCPERRIRALGRRCALLAKTLSTAASRPRPAPRPSAPSLGAPHSPRVRYPCICSCPLLYSQSVRGLRPCGARGL
eukprot:TRINITY_DN7871_c0_g1_i7.p1 TRINITY_DN7871_c0_g1~~TRINITY_DN7871_c0_g1_i7.p1  ORF type:complete len:601 (+),score=100.40 TRINITY_DN7871_c0_g1_i7:98-1900(+)